MSNLTITLSLMGCLLSILVTAQTENDTPPLQSVSLTEREFFQTVVEGNNRFAFDYYEKIKGKTGNIFFSPYNIVSGLAMAALGAKGETAIQFQRLFHYSLSLLPLLNDLNESLQSESSTSKNEARVWLGNVLWLRNDFTLIPSFKLAMQRNFKDSLFLIDFVTGVGKSVQKINQTILKKTNGKIHSIVNEQDVTSRTRFLLTTSIYMRGAWEKPFDTNKTSRLPFRLTSQRTFVTDMMHTVSNYDISKGEKWDILIMPFLSSNKENHLAMAIILPKEVGVQEIEKNLTLENWKNWMSQLQNEVIAVTLPKLRIEGRFDLQMSLKSLGLTTAFNPDANFSGITAKEGLYIDKAVHKTILRIDEKGFDVASLPQMVNFNQNMTNENPYIFLADHPFLFVIFDMKTQSILFIGRVSLP